MRDPAATGSDGGGGTIFDEIRRQVEEMMTGRRPVGPQVIPQPVPRQPASQGPDLGMVAVTVGSYWLLAVAAARRRRRARQQTPEAPPQA